MAMLLLEAHSVPNICAETMPIFQFLLATSNTLTRGLREAAASRASIAFTPRRCSKQDCTSTRHVHRCGARPIGTGRRPASFCRFRHGPTASLLTLRHARVQVNVHEYKPILTEFLIWVRLGFTNRKITAPVLFRAGQDCLMDSHAIARIVDGARALGS